MDYVWIAVVGILVLLLILFIILRNKKDQHKFEDEINEAEIKPDQHDAPKI